MVPQTSSSWVVFISHLPPPFVDKRVKTGRKAPGQFHHGSTHISSRYPCGRHVVRRVLHKGSSAPGDCPSCPRLWDACCSKGHSLSLPQVLGVQYNFWGASISNSLGVHHVPSPKHNERPAYGQF